jgi:Protein of unknown function (DUF4232)
MKLALVATWIVVCVALPSGSAFRVSDAYAVQAPATCQNLQLAIRAQSSQGAAGHLAIIFRIHNLSRRTCALFGYPGIQLLDRNFLSLPTTVHRGPGGLVGAIPPSRVALGAGGNAYFALGYSDVPVNNHPCYSARYLMIFAPNDYLPVVTYASSPGGVIVACSGKINVSPVTAHPRFQ